jgi:hypothetical protein
MRGNCLEIQAIIKVGCRIGAFGSMGRIGRVEAADI